MNKGCELGGVGLGLGLRRIFFLPAWRCSSVSCDDFAGLSAGWEYPTRAYTVRVSGRYCTIVVFSVLVSCQVNEKSTTKCILFTSPSTSWHSFPVTFMPVSEDCLMRTLKVSSFHIREPP